MSINNNYVKVIAGLTLAVSSVPVFAPVYSKAATFPDVPDSAYYSDAVRELAERGILNGFGDGTYKPNEVATRGQFAKILASILGLDTKNVVDPGFTDVLPSNPYYGAIAALAQAGIISGYEDRTFRMNEPIRRNHLAKMLVKAFQLQSPVGATMPLTDVIEEYKDYVLALYTNGITTGRTATEFDGGSYVTRGQLAAFVVRTEKAILSVMNEEEKPNTELNPPIESLLEPEPTLTFTVSLEGMTGIFSINKEYELVTSAVIGKVYLEGDVVKITFVSEEAIPKESFKAKINNVEYEFNFNGHEDKLIMTKIKETISPVPEPTSVPYSPTTILVTGISLNITTATMNQGETTQLTASILPANATNKNVTWSSSNENVAKVDATGKVTAIGGGTATITAATVDGLKTATVTIEVVVPVTGISLNTTTATMNQGETTQLTASILPATATNQSVTWSSSDQNVATVDATGKVTAIGGGTATITAATVDGLKTATVTIEVVVPVTGISLNTTTATINQGETTQLTASILPATATNQSVTWSSSDQNVATVDATGKVTAIGRGTATITATTEDGLKTAMATIEVVVPVTGITLNQTSGSLVVGDTTTLMATVTPTNATNKNVTWTSSDPTVATVDTAGVVYAAGLGTATITATTDDGLKTATVIIEVVPVAVTGITLNQTSGSLDIGETTTLMATVTPTNAANKNVTWASSDETIATVDAMGKVTAISGGIAKITATTEDGSHKATYTVTTSKEK